MKTLTEIFQNAARAYRPVISCEIFPPKNEMPIETAEQLALQLAEHRPDFISVTYSAAGTGSKQTTAEIAELIYKKAGIPSVSHLTCIGASAESVETALSELKSRDVSNVLALRGDPIEDMVPSAFPFAKDLVAYCSEQGFCVGGAAYPEGHVACDNLVRDIEYLKQKEQAGASFFITQLCFDNDCYYRFLERVAAARISVPLSCGIMPIFSKSQVQRMVFMCGVSLPAPIVKFLAKYENSPDDLQKAGIEYATEQLIDLAKHGVDGLHLYTMNHEAFVKYGFKALRDAGLA